MKVEVKTVINYENLNGKCKLFFMGDTQKILMGLSQVLARMHCQSGADIKQMAECITLIAEDMAKDFEKAGN